jgi:hypothetical protein
LLANAWDTLDTVGVTLLVVVDDDPDDVDNTVAPPDEIAPETPPDD